MNNLFILLYYNTLKLQLFDGLDILSIPSLFIKEHTNNQNFILIPRAYNFILFLCLPAFSSLSWQGEQCYIQMTSSILPNS